MKRLLALVLFAAPSLCAAASLDTPVESRPTIRTEIYRGFEAARGCPIRLSGLDYRACIDRIAREDAARQPNTTAFRLGLRLGSWQANDIRYANDVGDPTNPLSARNLPLDEGSATVDFMDVKNAARDLGITDEEALSAAHYSGDDPRIKFWNDRYVAKRAGLAGERRSPP